MAPFMHWIIGPQLVGFIMLFTGWLQQTFPPTDIDGFYGYRTLTSKQNQQTFDEGNRYSAVLMLKVGFVLMITGLLMSAVIGIKYEMIMIVSTTFAGIGSAVIIMVKTEKYLENKFKDKR